MMETRRVPNTRRDFLISCLLVCCALLTIASFTFAMYTVKEFATLKARVSELEQSQSNIHLLIPKDDISSKKSSMKATGSMNQDERSNTQKRATVVTSTRTNTTRKHKNKNIISIHLAGLRQKVYGEGQTIKSWEVVHASGTITYKKVTGEVIINVPGLYFIYSQLQVLSPQRQIIMKHATHVNEKPVLTSILSRNRDANAEKTKYDSNYQGGVFPLQKGDRVYLGGQYTNRWFNNQYNYFGMFLLSHKRHN